MAPNGESQRPASDRKRPGSPTTRETHTQTTERRHHPAAPRGSTPSPSSPQGTHKDNPRGSQQGAVAGNGHRVALFRASTLHPVSGTSPGDDRFNLVQAENHPHAHHGGLDEWTVAQRHDGILCSRDKDPITTGRATQPHSEHTRPQHATAAQIALQKAQTQETQKQHQERFSRNLSPSCVTGYVSCLGAGVWRGGPP